MSQPVLVVEPDDRLATLYAAALRLDQWQPHVAKTAQAAILLADQVRPALVIIELQLVAHSGIEFLYEFRSYADWQAIPVLLHSAIPEQALAPMHDVLHKQLGVRRHLYKPRTSLASLRRAAQECVAV